MTEVEITMKMKVDEDFINELKYIIDHHIEQLIDYDNYPEIKTIYDCKLKTPNQDEDHYDRYIAGFVDPINFDVHYMSYFAAFDPKSKTSNGYMVNNPREASRYISIEDFEKDYGSKIKNKLTEKRLLYTPAIDSREKEIKFKNIVEMMNNEPYNLFILKVDPGFNIKEMYVLKEER